MLHSSTGCRFSGAAPVLLLAIALSSTLPAHTAVAVVSAPILKWQNGGYEATWCATAWYNSPVAIDLDGNGTTEIIAAGYDVDIVNGADGSSALSWDPAGSRSWASVAVGDIDGLGGLEIASVHGGGYVNVFDSAGALLWSAQPTTSELRGIALDDLDDDGTLEVIVTAAVASQTNTWVYHYDGTLRGGWPQNVSGAGYGHGAYGSGLAVSDMDGVSGSEIIVPSDTHYVAAWAHDGSEVAADASFTASTVWGNVGVWENEFYDVQGWGPCSPGNGRDAYRASFSNGGTAIADLDGLGGQEVVVTGSMYDCSAVPGTELFQSLFIFESDRTRFDEGTYDWHLAPTDTGAPLTLDFNVLEQVQPMPVLADLDGDGEKEIVFASYDGRVHAFWLDKTEHGSWPHGVYNAGEGFFRAASEPAIADLDGDGQAEVIFTSWTETLSGVDGKLHVVSSMGVMLHELTLPPSLSGSGENGGLAAPTLADVDDDADLELVLNTSRAGTVVYDLPNTANARVLWKTSRGNNYRNGSGPISVCGDGMLEAEELCDDGNLVDGDGCSALCSPDSPIPPSGIAAPVLKWKHGGCNQTWCESASYASPAASDLDGDGSVEVVIAGYTFDILDGATGASLASSDPAGGRSWASVAVGDIDGLPGVEIATVHSDGHLNVFDSAGDLLWTRQPTTKELRGVAIDDLDGNGLKEIIVTAAELSATNTWIYEADGALRTGWPQNVGGTGYGHGAFSSGVAVGDMDGVAGSEIFVPSDTHYVAAWDRDGVEVAANPLFTASTVWGNVGVWEDEAFDIQGWGSCTPDVGRDRYRSNFSLGGALIVDVDQSGDEEIVVTGAMYDCSTSPGTTRYQSLHVFEPDRARFVAGLHDWSTIPLDTGAPLIEDDNVIEPVVPHPAAADLDGNGELEILYPSFDGRVHAFWLDKSEHGTWPHEVYDPAEGFYRFASEPVVVDLDDDGQAEVIFTSWTEKLSGAQGKLHVLDASGVELHALALPSAFGSPAENGGLAAPTLAELDGDADLELLISTSHAGVVAYDLPNTPNARVLWRTSRGNQQRTATGPMPVCGDGVRETVEACDDGNLVVGDGCSPTCSVPEPGSTIGLVSGLLLLGGLHRRRMRTEKKSDLT